MKKYHFHAQKLYVQSESYVLRVLGSFVSIQNTHWQSYFLNLRNIESFFINGYLGQDWQEEIILEKKIFFFLLRVLPQLWWNTVRFSSPYPLLFVKFRWVEGVKLLFFFWLRWVFIAVCGLSLALESGGYCLLWYAGFSSRWLLLFRNTSSRHAGFSSCGTWAQLWAHVGSRAQAQ